MTPDSDLESTARPGANSLGERPGVATNPLLVYLIGSLWKLKRLHKSEFNGKLCRVVDVDGTIAKVSLVGDMAVTKYRVNLLAAGPPQRLWMEAQ